MATRRILMLATVVALALTPPARAAQTERSPTCGEISGDLARLRTFCEAVPRGAVERANATGSVLSLSVTRSMANEMLGDTLTAEALVLNWMKLWRGYSRSQAVTVTVQWRGAEIATGQTSLFRGDRVTFRAR